MTSRLPLHTAPLSEICEISIGRTPSRSVKRYWGGPLPWLAIADMNQGRDLVKTSEGITPEAASECNCRAVPPGTLLLSFKLSIGKLGFAGRELFTNEAIAALLIRDPKRDYGPYLYHALKMINWTESTDRAAKGHTLNKRKLELIEVQRPLWEDQKRIAEILDKADTIRLKRKQSIDLIDDMRRSAFLTLTGDPVLNTKRWPELPLSEVAEVVSGVTKGRRTLSSSIVSVPYMRVANVQDSHIVLDDVRMISATPLEVERYRLAVGDLLLTEGGDPDKLGRGAVWRGEIDPCIHQNHIFRVRIRKPSVLPEYLSSLIASARGKRYFLRAAKQTTGIATINSRQLKAFPVLVPPVAVQQQFEDITAGVRSLSEGIESSAAKLSELFGSLCQRAFRGEL